MSPARNKIWEGVFGNENISSQACLVNLGCLVVFPTVMYISGPALHSQHHLVACRWEPQTPCQQFSGQTVFHVSKHPPLQLLLPEQCSQSSVDHPHLETSVGILNYVVVLRFDIIGSCINKLICTTTHHRVVPEYCPVMHHCMSWHFELTEWVVNHWTSCKSNYLKQQS